MILTDEFWRGFELDLAEMKVSYLSWAIGYAREPNEQYRHLFLWPEETEFCAVNSRYGRAYAISPLGPGVRGVPRILRRPLPSHVLDTIRKPFIIKRNKIDTDEQEAQKLLVQEVNRIHQSYAKQIEDCSKEIIILKSGTEREFKELSWKAEEAEKLTQKKKAEIEQMEKGFKIYSPITFSSYIRRAFIA